MLIIFVNSISITQCEHTIDRYKGEDVVSFIRVSRFHAGFGIWAALASMHWPSSHLCRRMTNVRLLRYFFVSKVARSIQQVDVSGALFVVGSGTE